MRVEIRLGGEPGTVEVTVADPPPGVPASMIITPDGERRPFVTRPPGHRFEGYIGDFGAPRELLMVTRDFLAGRIDRATAEGEFLRILAKWARSSARR